LEYKHRQAGEIYYFLLGFWTMSAEDTASKVANMNIKGEFLCHSANFKY
jgi:hypothetical protein